MKKLVYIIGVITLLSCEHKETEAQKLEREYQELKAKNDVIRDSINLEIIRLGGKP